MASQIHTITVDCANPLKVANFWAAALGAKLEESSDEEALVLDPHGPDLLFLKVPEGKIVKNRWHLDLTPEDNMQSEVERLVALGAQKIQLFEENGGKWTLMLDPESNEFCVLRSLAEKQIS